MLEAFRNILADSSNSDVYRSMVIRFAEALKYEECTRELNEMYIDLPAFDQNVIEDVRTLANNLLEFDSCFEMDVDVFERSFKGVLSMDVDDCSFANWISLNGALTYGIQREKLKALFDIGCDINSCYKAGNTPFVYLCDRLSKVVINEKATRSFHMVEHVTLCLQQNPSLQMTRGVAQSIVSYESKLSKYAQSYTADLTTFSLLTAFHMHGYDFSSCQIDQSDAVTRQKVAKLSRST